MSGYALSGEPRACWKICIHGPILDGDVVWRREASRTFPRLKLDPKVEGRCKPMGGTPFVHECQVTLRNLPGSSDLSRPWKELYRVLMDPQRASRLDGEGGCQDRAPWTTLSSRSPGDFHGTCYLFSAWTSEQAWQTCPIGSGLEKTAEYAFYYCKRVRPFWDHVREWTARIEPKQLALLDIGYVVDTVLPPFHRVKCVVFLANLAVAGMVIWTMQKKGLYDDASFSHRDLVFHFRHQLRDKIRCDRKRLDRITFDKR